MSIHRDFAESLKAGRQIVVMPISRLILDKPIRVDGFVLYPPASLDLSTLRPIPNQNLESFDLAAERTAIDLRECCSDLTGFDLQTLAANSCIAFPADLNWEEFLTGDHRTDIDLIQRLARMAEPVMDLIRFDFCRFDLPGTLPGRVGSWNGSGPHRGALLYSLADHESYLIAGPASILAVVCGIGLELEFGPSRRPPSSRDGEVGAIARHGLSLFTDVLESGSDTHKFMRAMILLEYLASPDDYLSWKKAKKQIACHLAGDREQYEQLLKRFEELTHIVGGDGNERGYRTLIVHHGQYLEEILPEAQQRRELFRELQSYCWAVLEHMLERPTLRWSEFLAFRQVLKQRIGVVPG